MVPGILPILCLMFIDPYTRTLLFMKILGNHGYNFSFFCPNTCRLCLSCLLSKQFYSLVFHSRDKVGFGCSKSVCVGILCLSVLSKSHAKRSSEWSKIFSQNLINVGLL